MTHETMKAQKKSGHPTQPGNRSTASHLSHGKQKRKPILYRIARFCKRLKWGRVAVLVLAVFGLLYLMGCALGALSGKTDEPVEPEQEPEFPKVHDSVPVLQVEYIFRDGDGSPVNMEEMTGAWAAEAGFEQRYELTDAERWEVASVVTAEAAGEPYAGKVAVAQCILQACEDDGIRPAEALVEYGYAKSRPEPTDEAMAAVQDVFDFGHVASAEPIKYFYAPARCSSSWHESQEYVLTINGHRFFKEAE